MYDYMHSKTVEFSVDEETAKKVLKSMPSPDPSSNSGIIPKYVGRPEVIGDLDQAGNCISFVDKLLNKKDLSINVLMDGGDGIPLLHLGFDKTAGAIGNVENASRQGVLSRCIAYQETKTKKGIRPFCLLCRVKIASGSVH